MKSQRLSRSRIYGGATALVLNSHVSGPGFEAVACTISSVGSQLHSTAEQQEWQQ
jgi:hypothetical protein